MRYAVCANNCGTSALDFVLVLYNGLYSSLWAATFYAKNLNFYNISLTAAREGSDD